MNEATLCQQFRNTNRSQFRAELPVGQVLAAAYMSASQHASADSQALRADLYRESSDKDATLIECKITLDHTAIGQVLTYLRLLDHDRELLRESAISQSQTRFEEVAQSHHLKKTADDGLTVAAPLKQITPTRTIVVAESPDPALLQSCAYHNIEVQWREHGAWRDLTHSLSPESLQPSSQVSRDSLTQILADRSAGQNPTETERELLDEAGVHDVAGDVYFEVSLSGRNSGVNTGKRADAVIVPDASNNPVRVIEAKSTQQTESQTEADQRSDIRSYYTAVGQALTYAALFESEFHIPVRPVVFLDDVPPLATHMHQCDASSLPWDALWPEIYAAGAFRFE